MSDISTSSQPVLKVAVNVPLSLQILGWLETDLTPRQIENVAGLAVFPLVPLMTATAALRANLRELVTSKSTAQLPADVTTMADFKDLIGFKELESLQEKFLLGQ